MDTNFNETFLDKNSASYNYYIGIPNMETNNVSDIENSIKMYKKLNLDYLSINIFNFYLHSFISRDMNRDLIELIKAFRNISNDDIVIYTGYNKNEITIQIKELQKYSNIIIKYGRFIPNCNKHYDEELGIYLSSDNQYAERIS